MLTQVAAAHESIDARGWDVVRVAPRAAHQAQALLVKGHPFDLYLDRERSLYGALGARPQSLTYFVFNVVAWWRYVKALIRHRRQWRITGHYSNVPAVFLTDASGTITRRWVGGGIGDYPPLHQVLDALD